MPWLMNRDSGGGFGVLNDPDYLKRDPTYFGRQIGGRIPTLFGNVNFSEKQWFNSIKNLSDKRNDPNSLKMGRNISNETLKN